MGLHHGPANRAISAVPIVEAIVAMAHKLDKAIVAEGVETEAQRRFLTGLGVDYAQGFHFAKPLHAARAERLLRRVTAARPPVHIEAEMTPLLLRD
jgi:EAL domain-containing protein (putative c-di-GMP-specific phosphodiesterase class I)